MHITRCSASSGYNPWPRYSGTGLAVLPPRGVIWNSELLLKAGVAVKNLFFQLLEVPNSFTKLISRGPQGFLEGFLEVTVFMFLA